MTAVQHYIDSDSVKRALAILNDHSRIIIDFPAGAYGNFLSGICNAMAGDPVLQSTIFRASGSSHNVKGNQQEKKFVAFHWYHMTRLANVNYKSHPNKVAITLKDSDFFIWIVGLLKRLNDASLDLNELDKNTFNKFNNDSYSSVNDDLKNNFLPKDTIFNEHFPDCPRSVLRDYFRVCLSSKSFHNIFEVQNTILKDNNAFVFDFCNFHNGNLIDKLTELFDYFNVEIKNIDVAKQMYSEFLTKQPAFSMQVACDNILHNIRYREVKELNLNILEESYIAYNLEKEYNISCPMENEFFKSTSFIISFLKENNKL